MDGGRLNSVPRSGRRSIHRTRLSTLLDRVTETGILLVSAGAGFGKTTALASWASESDDACVAWVGCGVEHNDPQHLAAELSSALRSAVPHADAESLGGIADAIAASDVVVNVVLDDAHHLKNPAAWSAVEDLLRRRPANLRVVVSGRDDEGLPWHRLCALGDVSEVRGGDLCFTRAETELLLTETFGVDDPEHAVDDLLTATDGWVTGLCLAGHALRQGSASVTDCSGLARQRHVRRFFDDELIRDLDDGHVRFLEATAVLERLDPELCDLLTGRSDSHEVLEFFVDHNLFTQQVSSEPPVYRYHQLFSEYLRARTGGLHEATSVERLERASRWYEEHGLPDLAIDAAVRCGGTRRVETLIRSASGEALRAGLPHTVARWLSAVPLESLDANPDLALLLARSAGASGDLLAVRTGLEAVESSGCLADASSSSFRLAHQSLVFLLALWTGDFDQADVELSRAEEFAAAHHGDLDPDMFALDPADLTAYRALMHLLWGDFDVALACAEDILTPGRLTHPDKSAVLTIAVRALALAWGGDLAAARESTEQSRAAVHAFGGRTGGVLTLLLAGVWCADLEQATADLASLRTIVGERQLPLYRANHFLAEARLNLRYGRPHDAEASLGAASDVIDAMPSSGALSMVRDQLRCETATAKVAGIDGAFTERERAVLFEIAAGASRREAATHLYLSVNTVKTHLRSVYRKLGATCREDAVERAQELGLLDPVSP